MQVSGRCHASIFLHAEQWERQQNGCQWTKATQRHDAMRRCVNTPPAKDVTSYEGCLELTSLPHCVSPSCPESINPCGGKGRGRSGLLEDHPPHTKHTALEFSLAVFFLAIFLCRCWSNKPGDFLLGDKPALIISCLSWDQRPVGSASTVARCTLRCNTDVHQQKKAIMHVLVEARCTHVHVYFIQSHEYHFLTL
jgi:hypothetical protein